MKNTIKMKNGSEITYDTEDDIKWNTTPINDYVIKQYIEEISKEKSANDIEASIPVSEFAEYCSALDKKRYSKAFDIRSRKAPSKSFFSSTWNYEGDNWIKEMYDKIGNNNEEFKKLYQGTWIDECTPITKSNFEKLMANIEPKEEEWDLTINFNKPKTKEMKKEIIGYKFKNESAFNKFCQFMITFYNTYWANGYKSRWFNEKGYDIGLKNDITLERLKKHNLLDDLLTPVYKKESNYKTELNKALDNIDKVRKALEKIDSAIKKIKSND